MGPSFDSLGCAGVLRPQLPVRPFLLPSKHIIKTKTRKAKTKKIRLCAVDGNAKWCSHCEKQKDASSKN